MRHGAYQIGGACAGWPDAQGGVGGNDGFLLPGKVLGKAQRLPVAQVHARWVERGRHSSPRPLRRPRLEELQPGVAQVLVTHARYLNAGDGHQVNGAIDLAQGDYDLHGLLHARAGLAGQHGFFFTTQSQRCGASVLQIVGHDDALSRPKNGAAALTRR